jgi:type VI secretion system protein ImpE
MKARELFHAGDLQGAITAALDAVRNQPDDKNSRWTLCELLCFTADWERADKHLDVISHSNPDAMVGVSVFRQLLRAAEARDQFYTDGRLPEFLAQPSDNLKLYLEASILVREKDLAGAAKLLHQAEEQRRKPTGTCNEVAFDDFRDADDLTAPIIEVLASTGKYFWVPIDQVETLELKTPTTIRDLIWPKARLIVHGGPDGEVFIPAYYAGTSAETDDKLRTGRVTDWRGGDGTPIRGIGQRTFLVGDEGKTLFELQNVAFNHPTT